MPPTPPANTGRRFIITEYAMAWEGDTLFIALTTDIPIHLWLRWTDKPLRMHNHAMPLRGKEFMVEPKYCFVEWRDVEQNEPGDTLTHTFHFAEWWVCQHRWWGFVGEVDGQPSPSASCIFTAHYEDYKTADCLKHTALTEKEVDDVIDHADESVTLAKLAPDAQALPHTGLSHKEEAGVIDHADESINASKLAHNINGAFKRFNAKAMRYFYLENMLETGGPALGPGITLRGDTDLVNFTYYILAQRLKCSGVAATTGQLITGLYTGPNEKPRVWLKNIGGQLLWGPWADSHAVRSII